MYQGLENITVITVSAGLSTSRLCSSTGRDSDLLFPVHRSACTESPAQLYLLVEQSGAHRLVSVIKTGAAALGAIKGRPHAVSFRKFAAPSMGG